MKSKTVPPAKGYRAAMRTLTRLFLALLLSTAALLVANAPSATAAAYDDMTLAPNLGCPGESYCMITISTPAYYSEHGSVSGSLVNADTGAAESGLSMPHSVGDQIHLLHALPAGRYVLTVRQYIQGHWSCSIYNPSACTWLDTVDTTWVWKFVYSGAGPLTVPRWNQASASAWVKGKLGWSNANFRIKGRVLVRKEQADFSLGPWQGSGGRTILIQVRRSGPWKTIHKGTSKANGKFNLRFKFKDRRVQRWRIVVPAENGMPPGSKTFSGWR